MRADLTPNALIGVPTQTPEPQGVASPKLIKNLTQVQADGVDSGDWYDPPYPPDVLASLVHINGLHQSALHFKKRILTTGIGPHPLSKWYLEPGKERKFSLLWWRNKARAKKAQEFLDFFPVRERSAFLLDYLTFGYGVLLKVKSRDKNRFVLKRLNAKRIRVAKRNGVAGPVELAPQVILLDAQGQEAIRYDRKDLVFSFTPSSESDYYGTPDYTGAINDIVLGAASKSQRISYYNHNGLTAGLLVLNVAFKDEIRKLAPDATDAEVDQLVSASEKAIANAICTTKTPGKPHVAYISLRGIGEMGVDLDKFVKWIDLSQSMGKDDFSATNDETRISIYEAHATPSELLGTAVNKQSTPDFMKVLKNYLATTMGPLGRFLEEDINQQLGDTSLWIEAVPSLMELLEAAGVQEPETTKEDKKQEPKGESEGLEGC